MSFVIGMISGAIIFAAGMEYCLSRFTKEVEIPDEDDFESLLPDVDFSNSSSISDDDMPEDFNDEDWDDDRLDSGSEDMDDDDF